MGSSNAANQLKSAISALLFAIALLFFTLIGGVAAWADDQSDQGGTPAADPILIYNSPGDAPENPRLTFLGLNQHLINYGAGAGSTYQLAEDISLDGNFSGINDFSGTLDGANKKITFENRIDLTTQKSFTSYTPRDGIYLPNSFSPYQNYVYNQEQFPSDEITELAVGNQVKLYDQNSKLVLGDGTLFSLPNAAEVKINNNDFSYAVGGSSEGNQILFSPISSIFNRISGAVIKNLRLDININLSQFNLGTSVGGLVAEAIDSVIENISGNITINPALANPSYVGGLVGKNTGLITNISITTNVSGTDVIGGLVGQNFGSISDVKLTTDVQGTNNVGGLVGHNMGAIEKATLTANLNGNTYIGGLVGQNSGEITDANVAAEVEGVSYVGGLVGYTYSSGINDSNTTGKVSGTTFIGGLIGGNDSGLISNTFSNSAVTCQSAYYVFAPENCGGLVGSNGGTIRNSYSDGEVTATQFYISNVDEIQREERYISGTKIGGLIGYNSGAIINSYALKNVSGTTNIGGLVGENYLGTIQNSYSVGTVSGVDNVGGFVGKNTTGTGSDGILNSYSTGDVHGSYNIGGFVGTNNGSDFCPWWSWPQICVYAKWISNSYATGNAFGSENVGGFVGLDEFSSRIKNSIATGNVSGGRIVGGFSGNSAGTIVGSNSYGDVTGNCTRVFGNDCYLGKFIGKRYPNENTNSVGFGNITDSFDPMNRWEGFEEIPFLGSQIGNVSDPDNFAPVRPELNNNLLMIINIGTNPENNQEIQQEYFSIDSCLNRGNPYLVSLAHRYISNCVVEIPENIVTDTILPDISSDYPINLSNLKPNLLEPILNNLFAIDKFDTLKSTYPVISEIIKPAGAKILPDVLESKISFLKLETNLKRGLLGEVVSIKSNERLSITTSSNRSIQLSITGRANVSYSLWLKSPSGELIEIGSITFDKNGKAVLPPLKFAKKGSFIIIWGNKDSNKSDGIVGLVAINNR